MYSTDRAPPDELALFAERAPRNMMPTLESPRLQLRHPPVAASFKSHTTSSTTASAPSPALDSMPPLPAALATLLTKEHFRAANDMTLAWNPPPLIARLSRKVQLSRSMAAPVMRVIENKHSNRDQNMTHLPQNCSYSRAH